MRGERFRQVRSFALVTATVLFGISWTFMLVHVRTGVYPLLWALAMPPLAFYYFSGPQRFGTWKHLPAAALSIYAVVLWQASHSHGAAGLLSTGAGVLASGFAAWLGARVQRPVAAAAVVAQSAGPAKRARRRGAAAPARAAARR